MIVTKNNIHIENSYEIRNPFTMNDILNEIRKQYESDVLLYRSNWSLIREWITHNNLYILGYKREQTKDVDLNYPQKWYHKLGYFFGSLIIL